MDNSNSIGYFKVTVSIHMVILLILVGAFLSTIYYFFPLQRDTLTFFAAVIAGIAAINSAYYIGKTLTLSIEKEELHRSFTMAQEINKKEFMKVRSFLRNDYNYEDIQPKKMYETIINDEKLSFSIKTVLNTFENISIAIQYGYVNEEYLYKSLGFLIPYHYNSLIPYIEELCKEAGEPELFCEVKKLSQSWSAKKSLQTGQKI